MEANMDHNGPLSPDSAEFMALLDRHLSGNGSPDAQQQTQQGGMSTPTGIGQGGGFGSSTDSAYGNFGALYNGFQNQNQGQSTTQYPRGTVNPNSQFTLSPDSEMENESGSSSNYFGGQQSHQSSTSSISASGNSSSQGGRILGNSAYSTAQPSQIQVSELMQQMLAQGKLDVNMMSQFAAFVQSQNKGSPTGATRSNTNPSSQSSFSNNGMNDGNAGASASIPTAQFAEIMRAMLATAEQEGISSDARTEADRASNQMFGSMGGMSTTQPGGGGGGNGMATGNAGVASQRQGGLGHATVQMQMMQQRQQSLQAQMQQQQRRENMQQQTSSLPIVPASADWNRIMEEIGIVPNQFPGTGQTTQYSDTTSTLHQPALPGRSSGQQQIYGPGTGGQMLNSFSSNNQFPQMQSQSQGNAFSQGSQQSVEAQAMGIWQQLQTGGADPAMLSNPAFLQALRAMSQQNGASGFNVQSTFSTPGNWPLPGVETPEGSTGKAATESESSLGGSPEAEKEGQTHTQTPPGMARHVDSAADVPRPKASLPGKKNSDKTTATVASAQHRQASGSSSRQQSSSASPEAEVHHKRKAVEEQSAGPASHKHRGAGSDDMDDQDEDSDEDDGAPTKSNKKKSGPASRRKSAAGASVPMAADANLDPAEKAYRRKQQNRAAQKAFRERREQRVKDLEDKLAEMEAKASGQDAENSNLRQLLSKLQQENMALQSGGFSFSRPLGGNLPSFEDGGKDGGLNSIEKLPSPPLSLVDSRGQSGNDGPPSLRRYQSSSESSQTPASHRMTSGSSSTEDSPPSANEQTSEIGFHPDPFNAFASGSKNDFKAGAMTGLDGYNPLAMIDEGPNKQPPKALTISEIFSQLQNAQPLSNVESVKSPAYGSNPVFTVVAENPEFTSFRDDVYGGFGSFDFGDNAMDGSGDPFGREEDMDDFLRSLTAEAPTIDPMDVLDDDMPGPSNRFRETTQLLPQQGGVGVGSELFGTYVKGFGSKVADKKEDKAQKTFSPNDYLVQSPEPSDGVAKSAIDIEEGTIRAELGIHPDQECPIMTIATFGVGAVGSDTLMTKVLMRDGSYLTASQVWAKVQEKLNFEDGFSIDDLCDQMKGKLVCKSSNEDGIPTEEKMEEYMKKLNPSVTAQIIREAQASGKEIDYDALF